MLAQPALMPDSFYLWPVTVKHFKYNLRYTKFVETMVPIFSPEALRICLSTFNKNISGWGLDFIWPKLLGYPKKKIAVLDITPVRHTRRHGGGDLYKNIKSHYKINVYANNELAILDKYGVDNSWVVNHGSIRYYGGILKKTRASAFKYMKHPIRKRITLVSPYPRKAHRIISDPIGICSRLFIPSQKDKQVYFPSWTYKRRIPSSS
jgi:hypothetical protein